MPGKHARSSAPTPKVATAAVAGALVTVIVAAAQSFGLAIPAEVASSIVVLASFGLSYAVPESD